jgi:hypothetical protein
VNHHIPINMPGGIILAEVEDAQDVGIELVGAGIKLPSFEEAAARLKVSATYLLETLTDLAPSEVKISYGMKVGVEAGNAFWGLAKASGEANYTVTLKWKTEDKK